MARKKENAMQIDDLKPAPYNPRTIGKKELEGLSLSLKSFGDISGIVWNKRTGNLVSGHQRLAALKEQYGDSLKMEGETIVANGHAFRVRVVDWDEPTEKIANVAANNPHIAGMFIQDDLDAIIAELGETEWASQIEPLNIDKLATPIEAIEDGVLNESHIEVRAKLGDVWQCGSHRITCGDSTDEPVALRVLQNDKPFMMVTDPPYGVNYEPAWREQVDGSKRHRTGLVTNDHTASWGLAYAHFFGDVAYVWHAHTFMDVIKNDCDKQGLVARSLIVWVKEVHTFSRGHYHWQHEALIYLVRKGKSTRWSGPRNETTVWNIRSLHAAGGGHKEDDTNHSTQKPVECMARPIRNHGEKGDYIYEPFSGSGTTLIACEQLERRCLAIELEPRYVDMALTRWEKLTGGRAERITAGA